VNGAYVVILGGGQHLLAATRGIDHVLHWSLFRRLHQTRALISHYRRRGDPLPAELRM
jgi:hypothetical protein